MEGVKSWFGNLGRRKTPQEIINRLHTELKEYLAVAADASALAAMKAGPQPNVRDACKFYHGFSPCGVTLNPHCALHCLLLYRSLPSHSQSKGLSLLKRSHDNQSTREGCNLLEEALHSSYDVA